MRVDELGRRAPTWDKDQETSMCMRCTWCRWEWMSWDVELRRGSRTRRRACVWDVRTASARSVDVTTAEPADWYVSSTNSLHLSTCSKYVSSQQHNVRFTQLKAIIGLIYCYYYRLMNFTESAELTSQATSGRYLLLYCSSDWEPSGFCYWPPYCV